LHHGPKLIPSELKYRMTALRRQALGGGFIEFLLLLRNERARSHPSDLLIRAFEMKRHAVLAALEEEASELASSPFTIGHIAIGTALSYLDFRFPEYDWRTHRPRIARWYQEFLARPAVRATEFVDDS